MRIYEQALAVTALTAIAVSSLANASDNKNYYAQFNLGASRASDTEYKSTINVNNVDGLYSYKGSLGAGLLLGGEVGVRFLDNFRLGFGLDYRAFSNDIENSISNIETSSLAAMMNGYYDFTQGDGFNPYVTVGLGFAQNDQKIDRSYSNLGFNNKETNNFAYKLGLGGNWKINDSFDVDIRYQYVSLGKVELGDAYDSRATYTNTTTKSGKLSANEVLVGLAVKF